MSNFGTVLDDHTRGEVFALVKRIGLIKAGMEIGIAPTTLKFALGGCTISRLTTKRLERWLEDIKIAREAAKDEAK